MSAPKLPRQTDLAGDHSDRKRCESRAEDTKLCGWAECAGLFGARVEDGSMYGLLARNSRRTSGHTRDAIG
jgi:hypothetical protein